MLFVTVQLYRTSIVVGGHDWLSHATEFNHRSERLWDAGHATLRAKRKRNDFLFFVATTGSATERQRGPHQLQPAPSRNAVVFKAFGGSAKVAFDSFVETLHVLDVFQVWNGGRELRFSLFQIGLVHVWQASRERNCGSCTSELAVAGRATEVWIDVEFFNPLLAVLFRILNLEIQFGYQSRVADVRGGVAVAIETPLHRKRFLLLNDFHLIDAAVAGNTTNASHDVSSVVEVHKIRQVMDAFPLDGFFVIFKTDADRL